MKAAWVGGEPDVHAHAFVPPVGDRRQTGIEAGAKRLDQAWQRVGEVAVLAAAEPMPGHDKWLRKPSPPPYSPAVAPHSSPVSSFGRITQPCASRLMETPGQSIVSVRRAGGGCLMPRPPF